jgi:hypothetical protein
MTGAPHAQPSIMLSYFLFCNFFLMILLLFSDFVEEKRKRKKREKMTYLLV